MPRQFFMAARVVATLCLLVSIVPLAIGQEKDKNTEVKLPNYLVDIVTASQKQQIRGIQERHAKQIADLQAQIDAAAKQCDTEIESLLNADQKAKTKKARDELAAKAKKAAEEKKVADELKTKTAEESKTKATKLPSAYGQSLLNRQ
jgi:hypothetical protein